MRSKNIGSKNIGMREIGVKIWVPFEIGDKVYFYYSVDKGVVEGEVKEYVMKKDKGKMRVCIIVGYEGFDIPFWDIEWDESLFGSREEAEGGIE